MSPIHDAISELLIELECAVSAFAYLSEKAKKHPERRELIRERDEALKDIKSRLAALKKEAGF